MFRKRNCPVCLSEESDRVFTAPCEEYFADKFNIPCATVVKCRKCKTLYTNPILNSEIENAQYKDPSSGYSAKTFSKPEDICRLDHHIIFLELKEHMRANNPKVLDFGCGRGALIYLCQKEDISALGIDFNPNSIDLGRSLGIDNLYEKELRSIESDSYDLIVSNHVFEHLDLCLPIVQEFKRILKSDGCVLIAVPNCNSIKFLIKRRLYWKSPYQHMNGLTPKSLDALFVSSGFESISLKCPFFAELSNSSIKTRLSMSLTKFFGNMR